MHQPEQSETYSWWLFFGFRGRCGRLPSASRHCNSNRRQHCTARLIEWLLWLQGTHEYRLFPVLVAFAAVYSARQRLTKVAAHMGDDFHRGYG